MFRIAAVWVIVGVSMTSADEPKDPKTLDVPAEKTTAAAALIAKWDDGSVAVRDRATADLTAMGREALPALLAAAKGKPSEEVKERLPAALAVARGADFEARYPLFLADKDAKFEHDFLGWTELKAAVKDTPDSRLLFRDILEDINCRDMLLLAVETTDAARKKFENRWEDKRVRWCRARPLNAGEPLPGEPIHWLAAALLADLVYGRDYDAISRTKMVSLFTTYTEEGMLLKGAEGRHGRVMLDFVNHWVDRQEGKWGKRDAKPVTGYFNLDQVDRHRLVELFVSRLARGEMSDGWTLRYVAGTRNPQHIPTLRKLFEKGWVHPRKAEHGHLPEIQVRDAALSMCIALSGQDPTEYGFTAHEPATAKDRKRYSPDNYHFDGKDADAVDEKRKAAFEKWAEWEKANPDKMKAKAPEKK